MFDLASSDIFHYGDVILSFRKDDLETRATVIKAVTDLGFEQWAYSDRGEYVQFLYIPDADERRKQISPGGLGPIDLEMAAGKTLAELAS